MRLDLCFPTPIWSTDLSVDNEGLLKYIYSLRDKDPNGRKISNRGGWQSNNIEGDEIPSLRDAVFPCLSRCIKDYGYEPEGLAFRWLNSWANINTQDDTNQVHLHHGSFLSGVYYVSAPIGSGDILFFGNFDRNYVAESVSKVKNYTALSGGNIPYQPTTGKLLVFPSYLPHAVESGTHEGHRVSIAFNIGLVRSS
mgnify:CR=1 FL=1|tara:strand:- start:5470 stop:6057 length:588 start_codon:yes stop_codon:yes gene_type:complete